MKYLAFIFALFLTSVCIPDEKQIRQMLEPTVEVRHGGGGASGTIIYSKDLETLILTNYHVVDSAVNNPRTEKETRDLVHVKTSHHFDGGYRVVERNHLAEVVLYDEDKDLALLRIDGLETSSVVKIAKKYPPLFTEVWNVGNPNLMGATLFTTGQIAAINRTASFLPYGQDALYFISSAQIYSGHSGGGTFMKIGENYELIGVPTFIPRGLHRDYIEWMAHSISLETINKFFKEQTLDHIFLEGGKAPSFKSFPRPEHDVFKLKIIEIDPEKVKEF